jgi:hypothetical protein
MGALPGRCAEVTKVYAYTANDPLNLTDPLGLVLVRSAEMQVASGQY